ncbi:hypothetical protein B0T17DRAFT_574379 [Bombardia bombarda]|uniref:Dynamin N-terminal domain-containing protein n=1 Tax=Bombardia bombarda TaxID=252184 RepID=A0AA40C8N0_9PEZI|nr:hypothetical protein B0T17DRAFT_574379 [Bombardia bombarda]
MASAGDDPNSEFAWSNCTHKDVQTRVCIKQQAVNDGFKYTRQLLNVLQSGQNQVGSNHAAAYQLLIGNEIYALAEEADELRKKHDEFEILIGVAGATGAGKTSLLNALLQQPELLPSGDMRAATASVCRVAFNHDNRPDHKFRAEVVWRSKEDVEKELGNVFSAVQERKELYEQEFEDEEQRCAAIEEVTQTIADDIGKICTVFEVEESDIENMELTPESILERNNELLQRLGTTLTISSAEPEQFSQDVKPYLDSTATEEGYTVWPLIDEVKLFVKADVLKHGIILVDLPGLSDDVGARSAVAEKYFKKLALTAIVSPAIRAVDEKTGKKLMSSFQEMRMRLNGKYDKKSFCVVLSKIDDINCDAFCKGSKEARQDAELQDDVRQAKDMLRAYNETDKQLKQARKTKRSLDAKMKKRDLIKERSKQAGLVKKHEHDRARIDQQMANLESRKMHRCVWLRNEFIKKRIQLDLKRQQNKLAREVGGKPQNDNSVEVFPVSPKAFRYLLMKQKMVLGFPSELYTGIPRLRQWLDKATLDTREHHLDLLLQSLQRIFHGIREWSRDDSRGLVKGAEEIKKINPMPNQDDKLNMCKKQAYMVANRWAYKSPDDSNSVRKMAWGTYQAILRRHGGPYTSGAYGRPVYNFPEKMAVELLGLILEDWRKTFDIEIPQAVEPILERAGQIWVQYLDEVKGQIDDTAPGIIPYFNDTTTRLQKLEEEMRASVKESIKSICDASQQVHYRFVETLKEELIPCFDDALKIVGKGHFNNRQKFICQTVQQNGRGMFLKGYSKMTESYKTEVDALPAELAKASKFAIKTAKNQIGLLLNNLEAVHSEDKTALDNKTRLQQNVQALIFKWKANWRVPEVESVASETKENDIPKEYIEGHGHADDDDVDVVMGEGDGVRVGSDSDSDDCE